MSARSIFAIGRSLGISLIGPNGQDLVRVDMVLMGVAQPFISACPAAVVDYESGSPQLYRNVRVDGMAV